MTALLRTWLTAVVATWPAVLAWYVGGSAVRAAVLFAAAPLGRESALAAYLLLPIAVLARLVGYVGMLLAVRRAMPALTAVAGVPQEGRRVGAFLDVLSPAIVPFFVLYGLVGLLQEDVANYANRAARYSFGVGLRVLDPGTGPLVIAVIVLAFAARLAVKHLADRLPRWFALVETYLEAVWIFVAVSGIAAVLGPVTAWIRDRRVVHGVLDAREWLRGLWTPIRVAIDGVDGLVPLVLQVIALPLAWLLIAGIVHTRDLAAVAEERVVPRRAEARLRALLGRLPERVSRRRGLVTDEWDGLYKPSTVAARLVVRTEPGAVAAFLALSALLVAGGQWAVFGVTRAIGPQEVGWWIVAYPVVGVAVGAVVETLRVALLGAAFDRALAAWQGRRLRSSTPSAPGSAPAAAPAGAPSSGSPPSP